MKPIHHLMVAVLCIGPHVSLASTSDPSPTPTTGSRVDAEVDASCGCQHSEKIEAASEQIRNADSLAEARRLALEPTQLAHSALSKALWLMPEDSGLQSAESSLGAYHARIDRARNPEEVALEFESMFVQPNAAIRIPARADVEVDVDDGGCEYSGGEIIATVLGFILGILPGIILLILLC